MQKYAVLAITMLMSLIAFSQTNTPSSSKISDSLVCLPKAVAREVIKDLIRKDSLEAELDIQKKKFELSQQNSNLKDSIISNKDAIISLYSEKENEWKTILSLKDKQMNEYMELSKKLEGSINRSKKFGTFFAGSSISLIIVTTVLMLVK